MIASIIITGIIICYYIFYFGFIISLVPVLWIKLLLAIIPIGLAGTMIYVCRQRINEIRGGENDDLDNY